MATIAIEKKRKNIDLSVDTLKKLSIMAASQGKSVKAFIENLLENTGIEDAKQGRVTAYTIDDIKNLLGV